MTAHLQSAARAFEAVMRDLRPEHHWIGEVRPGQLDERAGNSAAAVRGDQAGAVRDHAAAIPGRGAERERIVAALEADYRANVADGADGIYTDGLHDAWRLTVRRAKRDDLIKPVSGSSEPRKETT